MVLGKLLAALQYSSCASRGLIEHVACHLNACVMSQRQCLQQGSTRALLCRMYRELAACI